MTDTISRRAFLGAITLSPLMARALFKQRDTLTIGDAITVDINIGDRYAGTVLIRRLELHDDGSVTLDCANDDVSVSFRVQPSALQQL